MYKKNRIFNSFMSFFEFYKNCKSVEKFLEKIEWTRVFTSHWFICSSSILYTKNEKPSNQLIPGKNL